MKLTLAIGTSIALFFCFLLSNVYADSSDVERRCFVCRRTYADYDIIFNQFVEEIDVRVIEAKQKADEVENDYYSKYGDLINDIRQIPDSNLEFSISTVKTDLETFRKIIPRLDDIIEYNEKHKGGRDNKLSDIVYDIIHGNIRSVTGYAGAVSKLENQKSKYLILKDELFKFNFVDVEFGIRDLVETELRTKRLPRTQANISFFKKFPDEASSEDVLQNYYEFKAEVDKERRSSGNYEQSILLSSYISAALRGPAKPRITIQLCPICYVLIREDAALTMRIIYPR